MTSGAWNVCIHHDPTLAGLYRSVEDFAEALNAPILSFEPGNDASNPQGSRAAVCRIACGRMPILGAAVSLSRHAQSSAADAIQDFELLVVHSLFRGHAPWAASLALRRGRPHWTVPHGCLDPWGMVRRNWAKRAWLRLYGNAVLDGARHVIFSSHREFEKASRWVSRHKAAVVHWPTRPLPSGRPELRVGFRSRHSIPLHARVLLYLGRLHSMKRVLETVVVFCKAAPVNCHLIVAGPDGDISAHAVKALIPSTLQDRVHVVGPLAGEELDAARSAADGFISLSHRENFGYSAADAIAWRMPVILSTGHDLVHELPKDSRGALACGWQIPDDYAKAAEEAIHEFATAPARRLEKLADNGFRWAEDHLAFDRFRESLTALRTNT